jgi:hypothetical protein
VDEGMGEMGVAGSGDDGGVKGLLTAVPNQRSGRHNIKKRVKKNHG